MKAHILCTSIVVLATGSLTATAQEKGKGGDRPARKLPAEVLAKFDTDGDGKLSETEREAALKARKAMVEKRKAAALEKFDTDGDGKLSETEREAMKAALKARHAELLEKYDADGDGKL
ncbi:MAG: EF-hand domain-containing protein, partial [Verrucomicrobiales bacterium]